MTKNILLVLQYISWILDFIGSPKAEAYISDFIGNAAPSNCPYDVWRLHTELKREFNSNNPNLDYFKKFGKGRWAEPFSRSDNPNVRSEILTKFAELKSRHIEEEFTHAENSGNKVILYTKLKYRRGKEVKEKEQRYIYEKINGQWYCTHFL